MFEGWQSPSSDKPAVSEKRNARIVFCDELFSFWFFFLVGGTKKKKNIAVQIRQAPCPQPGPVAAVSGSGLRLPA
jgi:hypothetical protein